MWIDINKDPAHISKEKQKAKELRRTKWWQDQIHNGICHYCRQEFKPEELTLDHLLPLARGGKSSKGNCVPACFNCNQKKSFKTPAEMIMEKLKHPETTTDQ